MIRTMPVPSARPGLPMRLGAGSVLLVAAAVALMAGPARAQPQPGMHGPQHAAMHRMAPGMHDGMPMMMHGRMLDAVGATADQKTRLRDIFKAAGDDTRADRENGRALRAQLMQLMAAPQVDAAAAEALRQKQLALQDAVSKRMLQAMLDAQAVLTPEQRAKLAERMGERHRTMHHQHMPRHEHRAPDAPKG